MVRQRPATIHFTRRIRLPAMLTRLSCNHQQRMTTRMTSHTISSRTENDRLLGRVIGYEKSRLLSRGCRSFVSLAINPILASRTCHIFINYNKLSEIKTSQIKLNYTNNCILRKHNLEKKIIIRIIYFSFSKKILFKN